MSLDQKMIIYEDREISRQDLKLFFDKLIDKSGNSIFKYCDEALCMLSFNRKADDSFTIYAPNDTKNYFLLNGSKVGKKKSILVQNDTLDLFSVALNEVIGSFSIQFK